MNAHSLHWLPNWTEVEPAEFRAKVAAAIDGDRWVTDGNYYSKARDLIWPRLTDVVWLNYPLPLVFFRALRRTLRRSVAGEELFAGNRESLRRSFLSTDSILLWVLRSHGRNRRRYREVFDSGADPALRYFELVRPARAERLVDELRDGQSRAS